MFKIRVRIFVEKMGCLEGSGVPDARFLKVKTLGPSFKGWEWLSVYESFQLIKSSFRN
jgi:hypothetical protein